MHNKVKTTQSGLYTGQPLSEQKIHIWLGSLHTAHIIYCHCDCCFLFVHQKMFHVYVFEKVKTIFTLFSSFTTNGWWRIWEILKNRCWKWTFWETLQRVSKYRFIFTTLFGHQPTYKNLRGNTAYLSSHWCWIWHSKIHNTVSS